MLDAQPAMPNDDGKGGLAGEENTGHANAILVFLQGIKEIQAVQDALLMTREYQQQPARSWVLPIHSAVLPEEQRMAFARPPPHFPCTLDEFKVCIGL